MSPQRDDRSHIVLSRPHEFQFVLLHVLNFKFSVSIQKCFKTYNQKNNFCTRVQNQYFHFVVHCSKFTMTSHFSTTIPSTIHVQMLYFIWHFWIILQCWFNIIIYYLFILYFNGNITIRLRVSEFVFSKFSICKKNTAAKRGTFPPHFKFSNGIDQRNRSKLKTDQVRFSKQITTSNYSILFIFKFNWKYLVLIF